MSGEGASFLGRHARALVASLALVVGFLLVMRAGALPVLPPAGVLAQTTGWLVAVFLVAMLSSMLLKYARLYFLLKPIAQIPMRRLMSISCIAMALITLLPFRVGEIARPAMLREKGKVSGWALTATVAAERIIDGIVFGVALLAGLALAPAHQPVPDHIGALPVPAALVPRAAVTATAMFGVLMVTMSLFYWRRDLAHLVTHRVLGVVSRRLAETVAGIVERSGEGLHFLSDVRHAGPYAAVTLLSVAANVWAVQVLAAAVGLPRLDFAQAAVVLGILAIGFALPNAPGFFGVVQLALYAGLALYVPAEMLTREGAAFVFLYYVSYLAVVFILALLGLLVEYVSTHSPGAQRLEAERGP